MSLWRKTALLCGVALVLIVGACALILTIQAQDNLLSLTFAFAENKQSALAASFDHMLRYYHAESDSAATTRALVKYCFTQFADAEAVLLWNGETVFSALSMDPGEYLPLDGYEQQRFTGEVNGRRLLIVGSMVSRLYLFDSAGDTAFGIYIVQDITPVYEQTSRLAGRFALIGAAGSALGLLLITLLARSALRPLSRLQTAAARIAEGSYAERVPVASDDEVGALARDFNTMAASVEQRIDELTETAERQRLFIGGVTHEFKTPLTAILLNADSLQNTCMEEDERMEALSRIEGQCRWLERLVQKLLKLITLDRELERRPVPVRALLERVRESTADSLAARGVSLRLDCQGGTLNLDADLMQSALVNLVDNAGKACAPGQTVLLSADEAGFAVSDPGCGIPAEEIDRVTEPFYRVDRSRSKRQGGVGLGLALVKAIVGAHGGRLAIESAPGAGTTVRVVLQQ